MGWTYVHVFILMFEYCIRVLLLYLWRRYSWHIRSAYVFFRAWLLCIWWRIFPTTVCGNACYRSCTSRPAEYSK